MPQETYKGQQAIEVRSPEAWRKWLEQNHSSEKSVWLIIYSKESGVPTVYYPEAVDEALCFGWIDSVPNKRNKESYYQYFAKRSPKSNWSAVNKAKIAQLRKAKKLAPAGKEMIAIAKKNGTWNALDEVEKGIVPPDLRKEFEKYPKAFEHWEKFSRSSRRGILEWILNANQPETRAKRVKETVELAGENVKANH